MEYEQRVWRNGKGREVLLEASTRKNLGGARADRARLMAQVKLWEWRLSLARPKYGQLIHLINKFGGILPFAVAVNVHPNRILGIWLGVTKRGSQARNVEHPRSGLVSMHYMARILYAARRFGILLTAQDLYPDLFENDEPKRDFSKTELNEWMRRMKVDNNLQVENFVADIIGDNSDD